MRPTRTRAAPLCATVAGESVDSGEAGGDGDGAAGGGRVSKTTVTLNGRQVEVTVVNLKHAASQDGAGAQQRSETGSTKAVDRDASEVGEEQEEEAQVGAGEMTEEEAEELGRRFMASMLRAIADSGLEEQPAGGDSDPAGDAAGANERRGLSARSGSARRRAREAEGEAEEGEEEDDALAYMRSGVVKGGGGVGADQRRQRGG
jgi:hypothetical protein